MLKAALVTCLFLAACAPARLQCVSARGHHFRAAGSDLARAFGGATDEAAS